MSVNGVKRVTVVNLVQCAIFYKEIAEATSRCFRDWGWQVMERGAPNEVPTALEFIFGGQNLPVWEKRSDRRYLYFNMEQLPTGGESFTHYRHERLKELSRIAQRVDYILDASQTCHQAASVHLKTVNSQLGYVFCPIGYHSSFDYSRVSAPEHTDVLFIGLHSDRRKKILDAMRSRLRVVSTEGLWGEQRMRAIASAKINLNLHVMPESYFEAMRMVLLFLSSCRFCLSERIEGWNPLIPGEHYIEWDGSVDQVCRLVQDYTLRRKIAYQGYVFVKGQLNYTFNLHRALSQLALAD